MSWPFSPNSADRTPRVEQITRWLMQHNQDKQALPSHCKCGTGFLFYLEVTFTRFVSNRGAHCPGHHMLIARNRAGRGVRCDKPVSNPATSLGGNQNILNRCPPKNTAPRVTGLMNGFIFASRGVFVFRRICPSYALGTSITEWNTISGTVLLGVSRPGRRITKYQQKPEFKQINSNMTLEAISIFLIDGSSDSSQIADW